MTLDTLMSSLETTVHFNVADLEKELKLRYVSKTVVRAT